MTTCNKNKYLSEFPQKDDLIYLNHAAVAPWPQRSADAVARFAQENVRHGARNYPEWQRMEAQLREQLRTLINAPEVDDIALVKNTSEALSMVAYGLDWRSGENVVTAREEFPSNRVVWQSLAGRGVETRLVPLTEQPDPEAALIAALDGHTRLLSISSVQYASGLRLDLSRLGEACRSRGILFCVDAIQSLGALKFDVQAVGADFVAADGHKWMLGPEGLGVFYSRPEARERLALNQFGWHMLEDYSDFARLEWQVAAGARRFECGSPNMLGIHALSASLSLLLELGIDTVAANVLKNASLLIELIDEEDRLELLSERHPRHRSGIITCRHRRIPSDRLYSYLMAAGVICAQRGGGIRLSPHFYTPRDQLARAVSLLASGLA